MCSGMELVALASLASTVGGGYMQYQANEDRADAADDAALAEAMRQDKLDQQRMATFEEALGLVDRQSQQEAIDAAAQERGEVFKANATLPGQDAAYQPTGGPRGQPKVVQEYAADKASEAQDFTDMLGGARARLGAWGEGMRDFQEGASDLGWWLDEYGRQARNSAQIGVSEAEQAMLNAGNEKALYGNLLAGLGQAGLGYAGAKGGFDSLLKGGSKPPKFNMGTAFDVAPVKGNPYNPAAVAGYV